MSHDAYILIVPYESHHTTVTQATQVGPTLNKVPALLWSMFSPFNIIEIGSKSDPRPYPICGNRHGHYNSRNGNCMSRWDFFNWSKDKSEYLEVRAKSYPVNSSQMEVALM